MLSRLRVTPARAGQSGSFEIVVDVHNEGPHAGEETVFLFALDQVASVARPLLELKGFGKIALQPDETGTLRPALAAAELRFLGPELEPVFEAGEVQILFGPSAERSRLLAATVRNWSAAIAIARAPPAPPWPTYQVAGRGMRRAAGGSPPSILRI